MSPSSKNPDKTEKQPRANIAPLTILVLLVALSITYLVWHDSQRAVNVSQNERFSLQSDQVLELIQGRMSSYQHVLLGFTGLFAVSRNVSREEFAGYYRTLNLRENFPGMAGVGYVLHISGDDISAHSTSMRASGIPEYSVFPNGERDEYAPVAYLQPSIEFNRTLLGFDMYTDAIRHATMDRAASTGGAALTSRVVLGAGLTGLEVPGAILYYPVYINELTPNEIRREGQDLLGWVYAPFGMTALMGEMQSVLPTGFEFAIYDGTMISADSLMFSTITENSENYAARERVAQLEMVGQPWTVVVRSTQLFEAAASTYMPLLFAVIGVIISVLLTMLVWSLMSGRNRALAKAARMTRELREAEFRWKAALAGAGDGVWDWNNQTGAVAYSERWKEMLGYADEDIENSISAWELLLHPDDKALALAAIQSISEGTDEFLSIEVRMRAANGNWHWILSRGAVVSRDEAGRPLRTIGTHADISKQKEIELALVESERRFRGAFDTAAIGMALVGLNGEWLEVNRALIQMLGYDEDRLLGMSFQDITHPDDLDLDVELLQQLINDDIDHYHMEKRYFRRGGQIISVLLSVSLVRDRNDNPVHFVSQIEDVTERKELQTRVEHQATHDELTGLPNRRLLYDRLAHTLAQSRRHKRLMAVLFVDIDHFKGINDSFGHDVGDDVLCEVANRLRRCTRLSDTLARQGGDEFVVLLTEIQSTLDAGRLAEAMIKALRPPLKLGSREISVTLSIGVAVFDPSSGETDEHLLKRADNAPYEAKRAGRNGFNIDM